MQVENIPIGDVIPYTNNPRHNEEAIPLVANSIKEFGFKVPIVIDKNNVIVCGHTRYQASLQLGLKEVPCIKADDLSDEQIKAFRLADNKVSERAKWDDELLGLELDGITNIDMSLFDFEIADVDFEDFESEYTHDEAERTGDAYNLTEYDETRTAGFYQLPTLKPCNYIPDDLIGFNYMLTNKEKNVGIHYYVDDYQFERIWNRPYEYLPKLEEYSCCLTPDFSLYLNMPMAMKIWNVYRSRLIGQMCQDLGMQVIPTLTWAEESTLDWVFEGLPKKSVVSVSTVGVKRGEENFDVWVRGMDEAIKQLQPKTILLYGGMVDYDFGKIKVVEYQNKVTERMKNTKN